MFGGSHRLDVRLTAEGAQCGQPLLRHQCLHLRVRGLDGERRLGRPLARLQRAAQLGAQRVHLRIDRVARLLRLDLRRRLSLEELVRIELQARLGLGELVLETRDHLVHLLDVGLLVEAALHLGRVRLELERALHLDATRLALERHRVLLRVGLGVDDAREVLERVRELGDVHLLRHGARALRLV
eukprot:scaffold3696_cov55-Phaeocystis_antarctica.AAC.1